ncbi:MAG: hypothetical protein HUU15_11855 [Candidatus Brocadiae bacterium]|nr:hypothetical protein [Candidatus Brocadiia bacterium]
MKPVPALAGVLLCLASVTAGAETPAERATRLAASLGSDLVEERESAERDLAAMGAPARDAVERALSEGEAEVRVRASRILRILKVQALLDCPSLSPLARRWPDLNSGDAMRAGGAVEAWLRATTPDTAAVEGLLAVMDLPGQEWAFEALSWVAGPRRMGGFAGAWRRTMGPRPRRLDGTAFARILAGDALRVSDEASEIFRTVVFEDPAFAESRRKLDDLRLIVEATGCAFAADDAVAEFRFQTPQEARDGWRGWWKDVREKPWALIDLGLIPVPDPAAMDAAARQEWILALDAGDPRQAQSARRVLADTPDAALPELFDELSRAGPTARTFQDRLHWRREGTLLLFAQRGGVTAVWSARPDGSGRRILSGELNVRGNLAVEPGGNTALVLAAEEGAGSSLWRLSLAETRAPELVAAEMGPFLLSPDGTRLLALPPGSLGGVFPQEARDGALVWYRGGPAAARIFDLGTRRYAGQDLPAGDGFRWLPDSRSCLVDAADGWIAVTLDGSGSRACPPGLDCIRGAWSPDGSTLACTAGGETDHTLVLYDPRSGTVETVATGVSAARSWVTWSSDGSRVALAWAVPDEPPLRNWQVEVYDVTRGIALHTRHLPAPLVPAFAEPVIGLTLPHWVHGFAVSGTDGRPLVAMIKTRPSSFWSAPASAWLDLDQGAASILPVEGPPVPILEGPQRFRSAQWIPPAR